MPRLRARYYRDHVIGIHKIGAVGTVKKKYKWPVWQQSHQSPQYLVAVPADTFQASLQQEAGIYQNRPFRHTFSGGQIWGKMQV